MNNVHRLARLRLLEAAGENLLDNMASGRFPATLQRVLLVGRAYNDVKHKRIRLERDLLCQKGR